MVQDFYELMSNPCRPARRSRGTSGVALRSPGTLWTLAATAAAMLLLTGWSFHAGAGTLGFVIGIPLTAVAILVSTTHICIPSMLYNAVPRRPMVAGR